MKRAASLCAAGLVCITMSAQTIKPFSHLDGGITLGTTGIGIEATTPITDRIELRGGFDFYPHFTHDMHFNVTVGDETDEAAAQSRFQKMAATLKDVTGYTVDDQIVMEGQPKMYNFKLLVNFSPLKDKRWYVSAGFYWGNSKIATAENSKEDMTSLFAVGLYNQMYDKAYNLEPMITVNGTAIYMPVELEDKLIENGRMAIHVGTYKHDITDEEGNVIHKKGDAYNMEPDENCFVKASVKVNSFKPYLGVGYSGTLTKKDPRWLIGFDAGVLFWGGTPEMKTHDGTDLINDVTDLRHGVKNYVNLFKAAKVMPVLNFKISRIIF